MMVIAMVTIYDVSFFYQYRQCFSDFECNPLARSVADWAGPQVPIVLRVATTACACGLFSVLRYRHLRSAKIGVLIILLVHVALGMWYAAHLIHPG
jgi:hypothetical protein